VGVSASFIAAGRLLIVPITYFSAFSTFFMILPVPAATYRMFGFFRGAYCFTFYSFDKLTPSLASKELILLSFYISRVLSLLRSTTLSSSLASTS
jgi:hypothetical protein